MLTLYRCGRQAEALEVYRAARLALADELGLDPSPELQELERRDPAAGSGARGTGGGCRAAPVAETAERTARHRARRDPARRRRSGAPSPPARRDARDGARRARPQRRRARAIRARRAGRRSSAPSAPSDDDARRALATAEELGLPAGIATGEVVAGAGPVVNRAVELARAERDRARRAHAGARRRVERRLDAPLVGRDDELARLRALR